MSRDASMAPLVAVWSPSSVSLYDPSTQNLITGSSLVELSKRVPGRTSVVVAVSQRNTFIRTVAIPNAPKAELAKIVAMKLVPLLPVGRQEFVSGFRVAGGVHGEPRTAIVGAVSSELLKQIHQEAAQAGLDVKAILPLAFASWLAARERGFADVAVVESAGESLSIDIVKAGELRFSRTIPTPDSEDEFDDELYRTCRLAESEPLPVLAVGGLSIRDATEDPRPLAKLYSEPGVIERLLFSLEPLEVTLAREAKSERAVVVRSVSLAVAALVLGAYVAISTRATLLKNDQTLKSQAESLVKEKATAREAIAKAERIHSSRAVIQTAFHPAQKFTDVIEVLGLSSSPSTWFTGLTLERGKLVLIRGNALDGKTVATYLEQLSADKRFRGMKLVFANKATIAKKVVVQFAISGHVVGNLPLDEIPKGGHGA